MSTQHPKFPEAGNWAEVLQASNGKLRQLIKDRAWEDVRLEVARRDQLVRQILPAMLRQKTSTTEFPEDSELATSWKEIKQLLTEFLSVNQTLEDHLSQLRGELDEKLKTARLGRKTLKLYKVPLPNPPRFFDHKG